MTADEYRAAAIQIATIARLAHQLAENIDLDGFIAMSDRADALGPVLDPTLWMRGRDRNDATRALAHATRTYLGAVDEALAHLLPGQPEFPR